MRPQDYDVDPDRFRVSEQRLFGPFYRVDVYDTVEEREVPLFRGGSMLLGRGSVRRAVHFGVERYLRGADNNRTG
jgi:hypothetical protein